MLAVVNGVNLYYNDIGQKESVSIVLIHGFPFNSEMWKGQMPPLLDNKEDLRSVTFDLRGHGQSDVGDGQYTIELFANDVIGLLDHLKIKKTILCGFSMGGYIALRLIERNPDRFNALILCDTTSAADSNEAKIKRATSIELIKREGIARYAEPFLKAVFASQTFDTNPRIIDEIRRTILSTSPLGMCGALLAMAGRTDTSEALSRIGVPTLILVGEHDAVTSPTAAKSMHDKIPNSELHLIRNAGHMSNLENPVMFNDRLTTFLNGID